MGNYHTLTLGNSEDQDIDYSVSGLMLFKGVSELRFNTAIEPTGCYDNGSICTLEMANTGV